MFKHPTCGGTHQFVSEARKCEQLRVQLRADVTKNGPTPSWADGIPPRISEEARAETEAPKARHPERRPVTSDGVFKTPRGDIFKVKWNRNLTRLYAVSLVSNPGEKLAWDYEPGAVRKLDESWRMTIQEATAFGALYGHCVRCGRVLTREESIERAMGPICAGAAEYWAA